MIRVRFAEPTDNPDWAKWRKKADNATKTIKQKLEQNAGYTIKEGLYKEMRQVFLDAFHGKCAYCEAKVILDQHRGDVEHFRPKGRVTGKDNRPIIIPSPDGGEPRQHPGYPWLAYDWRNLLPSCKACNQPGKTRRRKSVGKWDKFPVQGFRASVPGEELREKPLLLHPVFDDPSKHLELDPATGIMLAKTKRGKVCIELLDLNREGLPEERKQVHRGVLLRVVAARGGLDHGELVDASELIHDLQRYRDGSAMYARAGRLALDSFPPVPGA